MPTVADPVEFTREVETRRGLQRCGNRVQLESGGGSPITFSNPVYVDDVWSIGLYSDEAANDNDKTITVTAGQIWQVLWIWVEYAADSTVSDRQLVVELQDSANDVIGQIRVGATQAEDETRYYMLACSLADLTTFRDTNYLMTPIPPTWILQPGDHIRIYDNNNVSGSDDMVIQMQYGYKELPA